MEVVRSLLLWKTWMKMFHQMMSCLKKRKVFWSNAPMHLVNSIYLDLERNIYIYWFARYAPREFFRKAPFYTCSHVAHLISLECLLIKNELGTTKGARSKMPVLTIWIHCSVLGDCINMSTLYARKPACFPKIRQHGNSESSFKYSFDIHSKAIHISFFNIVGQYFRVSSIMPMVREGKSLSMCKCYVFLILTCKTLLLYCVRAVL